MITIFTPTYNRANTLDRLYESLCRQTSQNFEWVVVDDGSGDNTQQLVDGFINREHEFQISYFKQKNGGKHRAINTGVKMSKGEFFFIVDSDDYLTDDAISLIEENIEQIRHDNRYCGVVGLKCYDNQEVIGGKAIIIDTDFLSYRTVYKVKGDRAEIVKTSIMRDYPFPEFSGEKFCTEAVVWNRISQKYIARYVDLKIYVCEYLEGGLTDTIKILMRSNPQGMCLYYKELFSYKIPFLLKVKSAINFWRYYFIIRNGCIDIPAKIYPFFVFGLLLHWKDKFKSQ